jgi:hypothetical protein
MGQFENLISTALQCGDRDGPCLITVLTVSLGKPLKRFGGNVSPLPHLTEVRC